MKPEESSASAGNQKQSQAQGYFILVFDPFQLCLSSMSMFRVPRKQTSHEICLPI